MTRHRNVKHVVRLLAGFLAASAVTAYAQTQPAITINDIGLTANERGPAVAAFTVQLSAPAFADVAIEYITEDRDAHAGSDYEQAAGTLIIPRGETAARLLVRVLPGAGRNEDRKFLVTLAHPRGASLAESSGVCTIYGNGRSAGTATTVGASS
ncbi:MAG: Calx-beta domain-containing protein [Acidobacteriota bacterium]